MFKIFQAIRVLVCKEKSGVGLSTAFLPSQSFQKVACVGLTSLLLFLPIIAPAQSNAPISFTKKEIAFFKWGNGTNEVGMGSLSKTAIEEDARRHKIINKKTGEVITETPVTQPGPFIPEIILRLDGEDNVYFSDSIHGRVFVVDSNGNVIRFVILKGAGRYFKVDEVGDVLFDYQENKGEKRNLVCVKPSGEKMVYKNFRLGRLEGGVAYDAYNKNKAITIVKENGTKELPIRDIPIKNLKTTNDIGFAINTDKIIEQLKKHGHQSEIKEIDVKLEKKENLSPWWNVIGIDEAGNIYTLIYYKTIGSPMHAKVIESFIDVYSLEGVRQSRIIEPSYLGSLFPTPDHFAIDGQGNIFQILPSKDGVHIVKWVKN